MELSRNQKITLLIILIVTFVVAFLIGFLSGYLPKKGSDNSNDATIARYYEKLVKDIDYSYFDKLANEMSADKIRQNLK